MLVPTPGTGGGKRLTAYKDKIFTKNLDKKGFQGLKTPRAMGYTNTRWPTKLFCHVLK